MRTDLEVEQGLRVVDQANRIVLKHLKVLAFAPENFNAATALNDALRSHSLAIAELWKQPSDRSISAATRKRPPQGDVSP